MCLFVNKSKQYTKNEVENYSYSMQLQMAQYKFEGNYDSTFKLTKYMKIFELSYRWIPERDGNPDSF